MLVSVLILRGSDTAASGDAYCTSSTVTCRSSSITFSSSGSVTLPSCTNQTLSVLTRTSRSSTVAVGFSTPTTVYTESPCTGPPSLRPCEPTNRPPTASPVCAAPVDPSPACILSLQTLPDSRVPP